MSRSASVLVAAAALSLGGAPPTDEADRVRWLGEMRQIAVHAPATATGGAPLLLVLGDPGRSARYALDSWRAVADREGFVVAAVSSERPDAWRPAPDGPGLLRTVVERMKDRHRVDPRRIYLFGAGGGGGFALSVGIRQPRYFAAIAGFNCDLPASALNGLGELERALPVRIYVAKRTGALEVEALERTAAALGSAGADVELRRLGAAPNFERRGSRAAAEIWAELSAFALTDAPRYRPTRYDR